MLFGILSHFIMQLTKTKQKAIIIIDLGNEGEIILLMILNKLSGLHTRYQ